MIIFLPKTAGTLTNTLSAVTGQLSSNILGNSSETFAYDSTYGELSTYRHLYSGNQTYKEVYGRDLLGRITSRDVTNGSVLTEYDYVYDTSGRLSEVWTGGVLTRTYNYSLNSNRSSVVQGSTTTSATYDNQDRILTYGNYSFTYNARGELSGRTQSGSVEAFTYAYNSLGAMAGMTRTYASGATTLTDSYTYRNDSFGNRIDILKGSTLQKRYIYDEKRRLIAELNSSGNLVARFVYLNNSHSPDYMIKSNIKYRFVHDHVGSIVAVVHSTTGAIASSISYDEFGKIISSTALNFQPFGFAGGLRDDATGFVRFGARDYDPETGHWASKDPILFGAGDTNLYGYVMNDPINLIDPSGLKPGDKFKTPDAAARDAINYINPTSRRENREYSGSIFKDPSGNFFATDPTGGDENSSRIPIQPGNFPAGIYHTHGGPSPGAENFSGPDIDGADWIGRPSWLGTPSGNILKYDPNSKKTSRCP